MTERAEAQISSALGEHAIQGQRIRVDGKLLKKGMLERAEDIESALIGMFTKRDNVPYQLGMVPSWW
jgi:hypothetical protein